MSFDLSHEQREEMHNLAAEMESNPHVREALAAELIKLRHLLSCLRKYRRSQHAIVEALMNELPRAGERAAFERIAADSAAALETEERGSRRLV